MSEVFAAKPNQNDFREHLTTIGEDGKRKWILPKKPKGRIYNYRKILSYFYYLAFFAMPFLKINGKPLLLLNFPEKKIILFGATFWPQDMFFLALIMIAFLFFIYLFTVAYGRIFCGWMCPQTFFMEMLFRRIDYLVLGDSQKHKYLSKKKWDSEKTTKYTIRYALYFIVSFIIANTFLAYIIGIDELFKIITDNPINHIGGLIAIIAFTLVFFAVFAYVREQVCTNICPYGRMQGVILTKKSLVIAYDYNRGEPRGKFSKKENSGLGDCIDCFQCVQVCPTGIDIRNGTQLECVNCTACIDACDNMMDAVKRPRGLIRWASENALEENKPDKFTGRLKLITTAMAVLVVFMVVLLFTRQDMSGMILRAKGSLYVERGTDSISNLYTLKIINKTTEDRKATLRLVDKKGRIEIPGSTDFVMKAEDETAVPFNVILPNSEIHERKNDLIIDVIVDGKKELDINTSFLGPWK